MNAREMAEALYGLLANDDGLDEVGALVEDVMEVSTYGDAGMLTSNEGLVVRLNDGSEFQFNVVRSRQTTGG
jgi:hypothetical protein